MTDSPLHLSITYRENTTEDGFNKQIHREQIRIKLSSKPVQFVHPDKPDWLDTSQPALANK